MGVDRDPVGAEDENSLSVYFNQKFAGTYLVGGRSADKLDVPDAVSERFCKYRLAVAPEGDVDVVKRRISVISRPPEFCAADMRADAGRCVPEAAGIAVKNRIAASTLNRQAVAGEVVPGNRKVAVDGNIRLGFSTLYESTAIKTSSMRSSGRSSAQPDAKYRQRQARA